MRKVIIDRVLEMLDVIDKIDDGFHNKDIHDLIKICNRLMRNLDLKEQRVVREQYHKKHNAG